MNNNKAILVVSFGTSYKETREKTIDKIEESIQNAYKDYKVYRAFTSKMIIKKLKTRDNIHVDTVEEAVERMINDGVTELIMQPTHIINGLENDIMIEDLRKHKDKFESIKIGSPLLTDINDYGKLVKILEDKFGHVPEDEALVFMGHGSSHHANAVYPALDYTFKDHGFNNFFVGTVEGYPEIDSVIKFVNEFKPKKVHLTPLMIVAGDHALNDMASDEEDAWMTLFENDGYEVDCLVKGLGEYEEIRDMFVEHVKKAVNMFER